MAIILGIAIYNNVISVAFYDRETKATSGTYYNQFQGLELILRRLTIDFIKKPISRTVIAWNDHFEQSIQKTIVDATRTIELGKISYIYHQTASAFFAWNTTFKTLPTGQTFGVINNHFNRYHLTLYRIERSKCTAFFVTESPNFDQEFANLALRSRCQNYFVNINDNRMVQKTVQLFRATNVQCSQFGYSVGDGIARGAVIMGRHLERSTAILFHDFLPYPIEVIYNHEVQQTIPPFLEAPFYRRVYLTGVKEGTHVKLIQKLPLNNNFVLGIWGANNSANGQAPSITFGYLLIEKSERGIESIDGMTAGGFLKPENFILFGLGAAVVAFIFFRK